MKITLLYRKSVHENAARCYQLAKESREKIAGLEKAMKETGREIESARKKTTVREIRIKREREWFEKFHHAVTAAGSLMLGGRNAQQSDLLVAKRMEDADLFFHADIQGGAVVILKGGVDAGERDMEEAAQFAACFSNAWKNGNAAVDVYAVRKNQLTKKVSGGFVPAGAFAILGERKWFRNTRLALRIGVDDNGRIRLIPDRSAVVLKDQLVVVPSLAGKEKGAMAKSLAKRFGVHPDELLELLPNGKSKTAEIQKDRVV